ncbi:TPA: hypothetical protein TUR75_000678 [Streptococcus equi subsp. zooepidemicus]|uniref:hypothetical protein n=1 Tax=Streptococcus equi TaxID=1336 RepID=UPI00065A3DC6|nr:hypothetical protein [Streptococcus equi]HEL1011399.1 hypothetical protein [Streptococcus equi subsp. ruminatorum]MCD3398388.1 hypothetical protein [Streptococcus equi subsp. zooepidemicus]MCD3450589.1 hypothetical protein [Streptococcus equi subsp. zooepidemicus]MCD3464555.1 hypothetical protein [Streptococcus equi subsp. zooepidemicus]QUF62912.1 hypothetical protein KCL43_02265 [Streptococcus equi subsp. zooepidemicus]
MTKLDLFLLITTLVLAIITSAQYKIIKNYNSAGNKRKIFEEVALENSKKWSAERYD